MRKPLTIALFAPSILLFTPRSAAQSEYPSVTLDTGTFWGIRNGLINRFLGIPFAKPPYVLTDLGVRVSIP